MKKHIFVFVIFLISFIIFLFLNPKFTAFTIYNPVQPGLDLQLTNTIYNSGDDLEGNLVIMADGVVREDTLIKLEINGESIEEPLTSFLNKLYLTYDTTDGETSLENEDTKKTLIFNTASSKEVAIQIPKEKTVDSINLKITGDGVKFPNLDFFSDDTEDLIYLGNPTGWSTEKIFSDDLDLGASTVDIKLNKSFYYCELIDLPYSSSFKIVSKYTKTGIDKLKGKILSFKKTTYEPRATSLPNSCTFTSPAAWSYCSLTLDKPISGEHLVCIYSTSDKINSEVEHNSPFSGYKCDIDYTEGTVGPGYDICEEKSNDYLIGVQKRTYDGILDDSIWFADYIQDSLLTQINNHLYYCGTDLCTIPIKVSSESSGTIELSGLSVIFGDMSTNKFFDSKIIPSVITTIGNDDLTLNKVNITIPLYLFNITTPNILTDSKKLTVKITVGSEDVEEVIEVYKIKKPSLENAKSLLEGYSEDQKAIAKVYGADVDLALINLQTFEDEIQAIEDSALSDDLKQIQIDTKTEEIEDYLVSFPLSIIIKRSFKGIPVGPSEVKDEYLLENQRSDKQRIQSLQAKVNIKTDVLIYKIEFEDVTEEKTLIKKTINGDLEDLYVIEEVPKSIVSSVDDMRFGIDNYEVIEEDPVVRWYVNSLPFTMIYALPDEVINVKDFSTLVIPKEISFEPSEPYQKIKCGDGICTKPLEDRIVCPEDCAKRINWSFVIILLIVLIAGIYYLNFYRGRYSFKELQVPKRVFKSKTDEANLRNYIRKSLNLRVPKVKIEKVLLAKGWSQRQIDHVFDKIYKG